jgi:hypothetical protein
MQPLTDEPLSMVLCRAGHGPLTIDVQGPDTGVDE